MGGSSQQGSVRRDNTGTSLTVFFFTPPHTFHHSLPISPVTACPSRVSPEMTDVGSGSGSFTGSSKPMEVTGGFCQRQNHSVAEQEFGNSPPRDPLVGIWCLCSWDVLQKDTFGLREAAIFQKSLDGNQPTNRKHYSSVASALLTNS